MAVQIQLRRGLSSEWSSSNPILSQGEPGVEVDTGRFKIGNGTSSWSQLLYSTLDPSEYLSLSVASATYLPRSGSVNWSNINNKPDPIIGVNLTGNTTAAASATLTDLTNGQISLVTNTNFATSASSINWAGITAKPTTLSGYGITDAIPVSASQLYLTRSDANIIYAPLASASLTGTPIAPTAAAGTNTPQIATTQFVRTEISNIIDSAPGTLDTLNELAAALGDDPNFATSTASAIGQRLLASTASTLYMSIGSTANHANTASSINWTLITGRPSLVTSVTGGSGITIGGTSTDPTVSLNAGASVSWGNISSKPSPIVGVNLTGDVTGAASATLTALANGQITISTTVAANSVALGTDTTGNYVAGATAGNGITISGTAGEGWSPTIAINAAASVSFGNITSRPTTLSGYGITDALPISASSNFSSKNISINAQTGTSYTLVISDADRLIEMNNAAANILVVPLNSTAAFPVGTKIDILQTGAGQTTASAVSGVTINSSGGLFKLTNQWSAATLVKRGTDAWVLIGDLSA